MKFAYTILYVENVEQTLDFYKTAFGFEQKFISNEKDYGELETGNTTLSFASFGMAEYNGVEVMKSNNSGLPFGFQITFVTEDVESSLKQALDAGATLVNLPSKKPWGQTVADVRDINGFLIEICTAVETN